MKRRDLLKQTVAFAALASLRASQAGAAETHQLAESLLGEKTAPPWLDLGPAPAETRKDNMLFLEVEKGLAIEYQRNHQHHSLNN